MLIGQGRAADCAGGQISNVPEGFIRTTALAQPRNTTQRDNVASQPGTHP